MSNNTKNKNGSNLYTILSQSCFPWLSIAPTTWPPLYPSETECTSKITFIPYILFILESSDNSNQERYSDSNSNTQSQFLQQPNTGSEKENIFNKRTKIWLSVLCDAEQTFKIHVF